MLGPLETSARALTVTLTFHDFTPGMAAASLFSTIAKERPHGIIALPNAFLFDHRKDVFEQVARMRIPAIYGLRVTPSGGLGDTVPSPGCRKLRYGIILKGHDGGSANLSAQQGSPGLNLNREGLGLTIPRRSAAGIR